MKIYLSEFDISPGGHCHGHVDYKMAGLNNFFSAFSMGFSAPNIHALPWNTDSAVNYIKKVMASQPMLEAMQRKRNKP